MKTALLIAPAPSIINIEHLATMPVETMYLSDAVAAKGRQRCSRRCTYTKLPRIMSEFFESSNFQGRFFRHASQGRGMQSKHLLMKIVKIFDSHRFDTFLILWL